MKQTIALFLLFLGVSSPADSPKESEIIALMTEGNRHFATGHPTHPHQSPARIKETGKEQHPVAAVLGCADSRVTPEIVLDQGIGDLFVVREAGNVVDDDVLASLEYAVEHLHVPLIVVLGHKGCGAIKAALEHEKGGHLPRLLEKIAPALKELRDPNPARLYEKAIKANVEHSIFEITHSQPLLAKRVQEGKLKVVGAIYDVEIGKLEVLR